MTEDNFLDSKTMDVYSYRRPPVAIDILIEVKGCNFDEAYKLSSLYEESIKFINLNTLGQAKNAAGRFKDLDDLEKLSEL